MQPPAEPRSRSVRVAAVARLAWSARPAFLASSATVNWSRRPPTELSPPQVQPLQTRQHLQQELFSSLHPLPRSAQTRSLLACSPSRARVFRSSTPTELKMKYILVSGGVISGIGKGVIGQYKLSHLLPTLPSSKASCVLSFVTVRSVFDWVAAQNSRLQCHRDQDRPVHEHRCWYHVAD